MSSVLRRSAGRTDQVAPLRWAPVVAGLLVMYTPSYIDLWHQFWSSEENAQGPLIVAVVAWLVWRQRDVLRALPDDTRPLLGWSLFGIGLLLYVVGRSQDFVQPDAFSQVLVLLGLIIALQGRRAFWALFFPICFLTFSVPLPGSLLDAVLLPLKNHVSQIVEQILYIVGYPIARTGVVLNIGPYQLLIANACSGLNSMIALSSVGILFVYLVRNPSVWHNIILIALILPIALVANILRVMGLVLITYHFGDSAGHSFHDVAGYAEIAFAFGGFFAVDAILGKFLGSRRSAEKLPQGAKG
jgi:exosortase B